MKSNRRFAAEWVIAALCGVCALSPSGSSGQVLTLAAPNAATRSGATAIERAMQALEIAELAAQHDMHALSLKAARAALASGPPLGEIVLGGLDPFGGSRSTSQAQDQQVNTQVYQRLAALTKVWQQRKFPAREVYGALADIVLPPDRPGEVFLYPQPLSNLSASRSAELAPQSVGRMLITWTQRAGRQEDLRTRLEARRQQPRGKLAAQTLLAMLALSSDDHNEAAGRLQELERSLQGNALEHAAELACHAALPALSDERAAQAALPLVERAVGNLASAASFRSGNIEPGSSLLFMLARMRLKAQDRQAGLRHLQRYLDLNQQNNIRYSGDYGLHLRKRQLEKAASMLVHAGELKQAFGYLSEAADISTRYNRSSQVESILAPLARHLQAMPADERYQSLHDWVMPTEERLSFRIMSGFLPASQPPAAFTKSLRDESTPPMGGFGALENALATTLFLIDAARQSGRLDELASELEHWQSKGVAEAKGLLLLLDIMRSDVEKAAPRLEALVEQMQQSLPQQGERDKQIDDTHVHIALAALKHPSLVPTTLKMLNTLITHSKRVQNGQIRPHLRQALATGQGLNRSETDVAALYDVNLALWQPAAHATASQAASGAPLMWISHDRHIKHLSGPSADYLYFRYPLTGTFEFSADVLDDGWAEGDIAYGGLVFESFGHNKQGGVWAMGYHGRERWQCPAIIRGQFNKQTLRVTPEKVTFLINDHVMYHDIHGDGGSPWLALYCHNSRDAVYRNLRIQGELQIPEQVRLADDPLMRGWLANFYGESRISALARPPQTPTNASALTGFVSGASQATTPKQDWSWHEGVITGRRVGSSLSGAVESVLSYERPLFDGESLSYEFFYQPNSQHVHPALGRIAMLLSPGGVRLHWLTAGDDEPSGLDADNAIRAADSRVGLEALPLQAGQWNRVTISVEQGTMQLSLNDVDIFQRKLGKGQSRRLGFFHFKNRTIAKVRNVVLRGDWPQKLDAKLAADLIGPQNVERNRQTRYMLNTVLDERRIATAAYAVYRRAQAMPPEQRHDYLFNWVMSGSDHYQMRLYADFTPTDPPPPVANHHRVDAQRAGELLTADGMRRVQIGGNLVAPAIELVRVTTELGRLDDLEKTLDSTRRHSKFNFRNVPAMQTLVHLARGEYDQANALLKGMMPDLKALKRFETHWRWPEIVAASESMWHEPTRSAAIKILDWIVTEQIRKGQGNPWEWANHIRHLRGLAHHLAETEGSAVPFGAPVAKGHWHAATLPTASSRGQGLSRFQWRFDDGEFRHSPGHLRDYLYFSTPVLGDYEVECELTSFGWREVYLTSGAQWVGIRYTREDLEVGTYSRLLPQVKLNTPVEGIGDWYKYRLVVKDGVETAYLNGREIHQRRRDASPDPWLAFSTDFATTGGMRNFRISGNPTVPSEIHLSRGEDLLGWVAHYYGESTTGENPHWRKQGDQIVGRVHENWPPDSVRQGVLQYHRPMFEDGEIEYEFRHQPNQEMTHPALDRLVLLLDPSGVRAHWLLDGEHDRTGLAPDDNFDEPAIRRGPEKLPLKENDWNHVKLRLEGDVVQLELNGELVCERELERTNQRIFGLHHNAAQHTARVRNVAWRGQWPQELPEEVRPKGQ